MPDKLAETDLAQRMDVAIKDFKLAIANNAPQTYMDYAKAIKAEACIVRPPGQCITIKNANFGDRAELWLDISSLGVVDLKYLCEQLTEIFSTIWDYSVTVTLPGEE